MPKVIKLLIGALGNAVMPALPVMDENKDKYAEMGFELKIAGACDSRGAALWPEGITPGELYGFKKDYGSISEVPGAGRPGMNSLEMLEQGEAEIYVEALPPNLPSGEPGTSNILAALGSGMHVVTANKAPLAMHWNRVMGLAKEKNLQLLFGTAASAGLNSLQLENFFGYCDDVLWFEGIFNCSANYVIQEMGKGKAYETALKEAKEIGVLDPDPTSDTDGWDSAMKCTIHANNIWKTGCTLDDAEVSGISSLTVEDIEAAAENGECYRLVSSAKKEDGRVLMHTGLKKVPKDSILGRCTWDDKVIHLKSVLEEDQVLYGMNNGATCTLGNVVLDVVTIAKMIVTE